jgi:hypothetical protein
MKKTISSLAMIVLLTGSIPAATLHVTKPNNGEPLKLGTPFTITWTSAGITSSLKLVLLHNGTKVDNIIENMPANTTSFGWTVGNYIGGTAVPGDGYSIRVRTMDNATTDDSDDSFTICNTPFALTAPNGGESWPRGSTQLITWDPCGVTGSVRLDLYKGGTDFGHLVGAITTGTNASRGKYSWKVGDRQGFPTPVAVAGDYYVVVHAYTPDLRDPGNGPFTIAPEKFVKPLDQAQTFSLTMPRRGDRWYKGTGYTITWSTGGLDTPVRLDLVKPDGTTVVQPIAGNIPNSGQQFWAVPMSLPDADTFYKMRIQTMDNAHSDTVGPFTIAKAKAPEGPPAIKVVAPGGPSQLGTGITYAVRWTSTCGKSANGPTDDAFDIELMNAADSTRARWLLQSGQATYDGGNPDGSHSWHWDWQVPWNETAGTFRIRVTSLSGHCAGLSAPFQLVYQQEVKEYTIKPVVVRNCFYLGNWTFFGEQPMTGNVNKLWAWYMDGGNPALARVGYRFFVNNTWKTAIHNSRFEHVHQIILRSFLAVSPDWYKDKGKAVVEAKLVITRKWAMAVPNPEIQEATQPCLGGVVLLDKAPGCQSTPNPNFVNFPPALSGLSIPIANDQGGQWLVDVTDFYRAKILNGKPDLGWVLYPYHGADPGPGDDCGCQYTYQNVERYDVVLKIRIAKDITH